MHSKNGVNFKILLSVLILFGSIILAISAPSPGEAASAISIQNLTAGFERGVATAQTAPINPQPNQLILLWVTVDWDPQKGPSPVPGVSGGGVTWVEVATQTRNEGPRRITVFRGMSATPGSGSVTITTPSTQDNLGWVIDGVSGVDLSGPNGAGAIVRTAGAHAGDFENTARITFGADAGDQNAIVGGYFGGSTSWSPGNGYSQISQINNQITGKQQRAMLTEFRYGPDPDGIVDAALGETAHWIGIALEIKVAGDGGGSTSTPQPSPTASVTPDPGSTFADVPPDHPYYAEIETLFREGYTAGCGTDPLIYCPEKIMDRAESAVFVERGIHSSEYVPDTPASQLFYDLPIDSWAAKWADALYVDGFTSGCSLDPLQYCPWQGHTRAEGAVFYLRMLHGSEFYPPDPNGLFADASTSSWETRWVEAAYSEGLLPACSEDPLLICPSDPLRRGLAAYMMVQARGIAPVPETGTPFGPFHFGDKDTNDYIHTLAPAFNGSFVDLGTKSPAAVEPFLQAARDDNFKIVVNIANSYPCAYWDGVNFDKDSLVSDAANLIPKIVEYFPDTVIGVMLLNEPHDPQTDCQPGIPSNHLYNAAREIRAEFAKHGAGDIYLGFGSHPIYIESGLSTAQSTDGTINLSFVQWHPGKGSIESWAAPQQAAAARMGHKLLYSVNTRSTSEEEVLAANTWQCQQTDALSVWWYSWGDVDGPKNSFSLDSFLSVAESCN
jgi:hypothetical protein